MSTATENDETRGRVQVDTTSTRSGPVWRTYLRAIGPGLVTGASDDDPSSIAAYAQAGTRYGFAFLWTCVITFPLMLAVQTNVDRTALATGKNLGELARERFSGPMRKLFLVLVTMHVVSNALVIAADLTAVAAGLHLLHLMPVAAGSVVTAAVVIGLVMSGSFATIAKVFKLLCLALLGYVAALFFVDVPWGDVVSHTLVPHLSFDRDHVQILLAVLGGTLPPYVFFWQSVHRLEELRDEDLGGDAPVPLRNRPPWSQERMKRTSLLDVACGMAFAVVVMFGVMVSFATTLGRQSGRTIAGAAEAAKALEPVAGRASSVLFALGFIGAGVLAIPVLAGAGSAALSGLLGRDWGFSRSPRQAPVFYGLVLAGAAAGTLLSVVVSNPIKLLVAVAAVNGATCAPLLIVVMVLASDRALLGAHRGGVVVRGLGWVAAALMASCASALLVLQL